MSNKKARQRCICVPGEPFKKGLNATHRMQIKIDTPHGKQVYGGRIGNIEPVFGNLRYNKGMDRFNYRGKVKVNIQWLLYCLVHNLEKIAHYGMA
jgi:IS5 family transposase